MMFFPNLSGVYPLKAGHPPPYLLALDRFVPQLWN
jgi:hypothetical protein